MYSQFKITADIETASDDYARRFSGATGSWMLLVQERLVLQALRDLPPGSLILEVGGGHGQLTQALVRRGFRVIVTGSAQSCKQRIASLVQTGQCEFTIANSLALPFADRAFAAVVCIRLLMHSDEYWPNLIQELCRVSYNAVIVDYPASQSLNCLADRFFKAKRRLEGNTRTFRLFKHKEVSTVFCRAGFTTKNRAGQFFLPMVLHRLIRLRFLSKFLESIPRAIGLTRFYGSPIILHMKRQTLETAEPLLKKIIPETSIAEGTPVLITGATGFTGALLTRKLAKAGLKIRAIARESSDISQLQDVSVRWFRGDVFDPALVAEAAQGVAYIFHVAAAFREARHQDEMYKKVHVTSTRLLAEAALKNPNFKRFIHISTVGVLGHIENPPADESTPMHPGDIYQITKAEAENWLTDFARANQLPFTIIRPAAIYGPGDTRLLKFFKMASRSWMLMLGYGHGYYHLIHVDDLTNVIILAASHPAALGEVFICGNPESVTLEHIARVVAVTLGKKLKIIRLPAAPFFVLADICEAFCRALKIEPPIHRRRLAFFTKDRSFNTKKLREQLGYLPRYTNDEGIKETTLWYCQKGWLRG